MPSAPAPAHLVPALLKWFAANARDLPWRRTRDPYGIWISEVMLQQTQVKTVLPYWEHWMRALPDVQSLAAAKSEKIHKLWEGLGYYSRARNLQKAAKLLLEKHDGNLPRNFETLLELPGIGRYTAGAICSIAFDQPQPILDGNIIRVLTRLFGITGDPKEKRTNARLWCLAEQLVNRAALRPSRVPHQSSRCSQLNQSLMELGALLCTPTRPACTRCPVVGYCVAHRRRLVHKLPKLRRRPPLTARQFAAFVIRRGDRFLVCQRPEGQLNAHLWEFPNVELKPNDHNAKGAAQTLFERGSVELQKVCTLRHSITRYRISLHVFSVNGSAKARMPGKWLRPAELRQLAFCSAHKRILELHPALKIPNSNPQAPEKFQASTFKLQGNSKFQASSMLGT